MMEGGIGSSSQQKAFMFAESPKEAKPFFLQAQMEGLQN
jgi:hypothetical protein